MGRASLLATWTRSSTREGTTVSAILVVEDRAANRALLRSVLENRGYQVETAQNGKEALELYRLTRPDVVVMDLFMPVMNGFDALVLLRQEDPEAKVVAVADGDSRIGEDALAEALALGALQTVEKPVRASQLLAAIEAVLEEQSNNPLC